MRRNKRWVYFCILVISGIFTAACTAVKEGGHSADVTANKVKQSELTDPAPLEDGVHEESEIVIGYSDLTHDGVNEKITVDVSSVEETMEAFLKVLDSEGNVIWQESAGIPHAGWNSVYLCSLDGKDWLMRYNPYMIQGWGNYSYKLFSLDEQGTEKVLDEDEISFNITGQVDEFDIEKMAEFYAKINEYLDKSILLLSTEQGNPEYSTENRKITRKEEFSWLYNTEIQYSENDSIKDKLLRYKESIK